MEDFPAPFLPVMMLMGLLGSKGKSREAWHMKSFNSILVTFPKENCAGILDCCLEEEDSPLLELIRALFSALVELAPPPPPGGLKVISWPIC